LVPQAVCLAASTVLVEFHLEVEVVLVVVEGEELVAVQGMGLVLVLDSVVAQEVALEVVVDLVEVAVAV
jgi:hypothetical protein